MADNNTDFENQLLKNALLFTAIRKNKTQEDKVKKVTKYLNQGADINATDANDKFNTPLHVAVLKGEIDVVKFLVAKGASTTLTNSDAQTAIDIANTLRTSESSAIAEFFTTLLTEKGECSQKHAIITNDDANSVVKKETEMPSIYRKRSGTSALSGQLYETKLLTLILIRALHDNEVTEFYLGVNLEMLPLCFNGIYIKYKLKKCEKWKIILIQLQHKDDPAKDKITVDSVLKIGSDLSLCSYFMGYQAITSKSLTENDCEIAIFTSAFENFKNKKSGYNTDTTRFLKVDRGGKMFQFDYDDNNFKIIIDSMQILRAVTLMQSLCGVAFRNSHVDNLLNQYQVYLAQNVLELDCSDSSYCLGKFRSSFLNATDQNSSWMKTGLMREIKKVNKNKPTHEQIEVDTMTFKLPPNFGNITFTFDRSGANDNTNQLDSFCSKLKILLENAYVHENEELKIIKVDDFMVGPSKLLQLADINGLAGLVGNLLILDENTKFLMFNSNIQKLSVDSIAILDLLQKWFIDVGCYRFDIDINNFPKLTLVYDENEKKKLKEFLGKITFYTNQPKEDEMDNVIIEEIDNLFRTGNLMSNTLFKIKCETIFLKVHDQIQKWWQQTQQATYLTKTYKFYEEASKDILETPLLSFLDAIYREKIKKGKATFERKVVRSLRLSEFLPNGNLQLIYSNETDFTSLKVFQFFNEINLNDRYFFIDLDFVILKNYFHILKSEINETKMPLLIVVCQSDIDREKSIDKLGMIMNEFKGIIIIITNASFGENFKSVMEKNIDHVEDNRHSIQDLAATYREMLFITRKMIFQGEECSVGEVIDTESEHLIKTDILRKIINDVKIHIGNPLTNPSYTSVSDFYINQWLGRHISLKLINKKMPGVYLILNTAKRYELPQGTTDIIAILESEKEFDGLCAEHENYNIHWFACESYFSSFTYQKKTILAWKKTKGKLEGLLKYVDRENSQDNNCVSQPQTLKDNAEKIVVINAEPGMGKSTFLTHLAIQTKRKYPNIWISKINFLDHIEQFSKWKQNKTHINMEEVVKFLYKIFLTKVSDGTTKRKDNWDRVFSDKIFVDNNNKIDLQPINNDEELVGLDLLEINLFNHFYNNNQVALLFDGFDEICPDYACEVLSLLRILKSSNVAHLWVTSRSYNVLEQLETVLGTFSFTLLPLSKSDQLSFLEKIWSAKLGLNNPQNMKNRVSYFLNLINIALRYSSFTSSPLNLYMVSEIFQDFFRYYYDPMIKKFSNFYMQKVMETFNLIYLYETFVEMKFFKIRFGEKKHFLCFKDPAMRRMVENERKTFLDNHKKVGAYYILSKTVVADLFTEQEINEVHEFIESVKSSEEKSGIIQRIVGDNPQFIHKSFAEYFATEYLFEKFQSDTCSVALRKYVINLIFLTDNGGVRRFINSKLIKGKTLFDLSTGTSYVCSVYGSLVTQNFLPTNSFFVAGEEYLRHIGMFMLICGSSSRDFRNMIRYCKLFRVKCSEKCDLCSGKFISVVMNKTGGPYEHLRLFVLGRYY